MTIKYCLAENYHIEVDIERKGEDGVKINSIYLVDVEDLTHVGTLIKSQGSEIEDMAHEALLDAEMEDARNQRNHKYA